jgi:TRAP-type C4-dicarboxylate transport system substrate-binding protein
MSVRSSIWQDTKRLVHARFFALTLFAVQFWALAASAATWELLSPFTPSSFDARNLQQFANEVDQATAGELHMVVVADPARFPNYYDLRVALPKSVVVFNKSAHRSLDPEIQRAVLNAAIAAQNRGWQASAAENNDTMDLLRTRGMTIAAPEPELVEGLRGIGAKMTDEWARRASPDGQQILQAYQVRSAGGR